LQVFKLIEVVLLELQPGKRKGYVYPWLFFLRLEIGRSEMLRIPEEARPRAITFSSDQKAMSRRMV
jgi:hypothetical protein